VGPAILIGRRRNGLHSQPPFAGEVPGITRRRSRSGAAEPGPLPGQVMNELGEYEDEASFNERAGEARVVAPKRIGEPPLVGSAAGCTR
jgi:hypothetical protein